MNIPVRFNVEDISHYFKAPGCSWTSICLNTQNTTSISVYMVIESPEEIDMMLNEHIADATIDKVLSK